MARSNGPAGNIDVTAKNITLEDGGIITATSQPNTRTNPSAGPGGTVIVRANDTLTVTGVNTELGATNILPSRISSSTRGIAKAGNVFVSAGNINVLDGATINTNAEEGGDGGRLTVMADDTLTISGVNTKIEGNPFQSKVSSSTTARGNAGDIDINSTKIDVLAGGEISSNTVGRGKRGCRNSHDYNPRRCPDFWKDWNNP